MQWFRRPSTPSESHKTLEERLHVLSLRIDELEKAHRQTLLTVEDALDRVFHWMQRTSARTKALQAKEEPATSTDGPAPGVDVVSARILARRARQPVPRGTHDEEEG